MGPTVFTIRKYGGGLISTGHDECGIHPMRSRHGTFVRKVSTEKAIVADRISNGSLVDVEEELEDAPPTDWRDIAKAESGWSWTRPEGESDGPALDEARSVKPVAMWAMVQCRNQGMSARETAASVPFNHATVSNWLTEYDDGGEKRDWVDNVEAAIA